MKHSDFITSDAVALRGIVDYLQKSVEPVRTSELAMISNIGNPVALRLCRLLEEARVIEHPIVVRIITGVPQPVRQLGWALTKDFEANGCRFDAEKIAGGP
jgi:succinyl-CoA synthetase alpha subunit